MSRKIRFDEENKRGREFGIKVCCYVLCAVMFGVAAYLASHALNVEGKEIPHRNEQTSGAETECIVNC